MSYIFLSCKDKEKNCIYGKISEDVYFNYLNSVVDKDSIDTNKYVCGNNEGVVEYCCDRNMKNDSDMIVKKVIDGYEVCKCDNDECKEKFCKDFRNASEYEKCKLRVNKPSLNFKKNIFVDVVYDTNLLPDCKSECK